MEAVLLASAASVCYLCPFLLRTHVVGDVSACDSLVRGRPACVVSNFWVESDPERRSGVPVCEHFIRSENGIAVRFFGRCLFRVRELCVHNREYSLFGVSVCCGCFLVGCE